MKNHNAAGDGVTIFRRRLFGATIGGGSVGLSGCVLSRANESPGTTVQLAADSGTFEAQEDINKALHAAGMPEDIHVEVLVVRSDTAQSQFTNWLSADLEQPTLLRMDSGWTIPFILRNQVADLSQAVPEIAQTVKDRYFDASVSTVTGPGGNVFGVPLFPDFGLILYRKDQVKEAGFDPNGWATNPLTWKRFAEVTKQTMAQAEAEYGFTFQAKVYEGLSCCTFNEFMTTWGGSYFGPQANLLQNVGQRQITVDADPVLKANRMGRTFVNGPDDPHALDGFPGPIAPDAVLSWEENSSLSAFTDGDAVAHRNWPYSILEAGTGEAFGDALGVMPMPIGVPPGQAAFKGMGGSKSALGGWHVTLNPNAAHREAAIEAVVLATFTAPGRTRMHERRKRSPRRFPRG